MDAMQEWRTAITRSWPGSAVLAAALLTHIGLNLWKIARRSTWRLPFWEAIQIALGLTIPLLLFVHLAQMRGHHILLDQATRYSETLPGLWNSYALPADVAASGRLAARLHRAAFLAAAQPALPAACAGAVRARGGHPDAGARGLRRRRPRRSREGRGDGGERRRAERRQRRLFLRLGGLLRFRILLRRRLRRRAEGRAADLRSGAGRHGVLHRVALLGIVAVALAIRALLRVRNRRIHVNYTAGPSIVARVGPTLLELSRMAGVPHASICGGRARCSTCRVRVEGAAGDLPEPNHAEAATLKQIHAGPGIRLACQLRPRHDITVTRMLRPPEERRAMFPAGAEESGVERILAILFLDIRGFTTLSEARLPYDTVFLLNRFFGEVGEATNAAGGWIDKYHGRRHDGAVRHQPAGRRRLPLGAFGAAMHIDAALDRLNRELTTSCPHR